MLKPSTKKFFLLEPIDKLEIVYRALRNLEEGNTAYEIARKVGCNPDTSRAHLERLTKLDLVKKFKIGRYKVFKAKIDKQFSIRTELEKRMGLRK